MAALVIKLADLPAFLDDLERRKLAAFDKALAIVTAPAEFRCPACGRRANEADGYCKACHRSFTD